MWVQYKTEDLNLSFFNVITGIKELKPLIKHISCECKNNFMVANVIQLKSGITIKMTVRV